LGGTFVYLLTGISPNEFYDPYTDECRWRTSATPISPLLADFIDHLMARLPGERPANTQVILQRLVEIERSLYLPKILPTVASHPPGNCTPQLPLSKGGQGRVPGNLPLTSFEFDVATVTVQRAGSFGMNSTCPISRRRSKAYYFSEYLDYGVILEMVYIPGGTFLMGSPDTEAGRYDSESPQHLVSVSPFYMGKFTITQAQWKAVNGSLNPNLPVDSISWDEAVKFCARLSKRSRRDYRLPSEAEWEYACRAGTITPFHFGETITPDLANYDGNYTYACELKGVYRQTTTEVGSFKVANNFGLYDMHGNVWEWCADPWHENYQSAPSDGRAWLDHSDNRYRILRGGSWLFNPRRCRCAYRGRHEPDLRYNNIGFRVACS
jgi:formylglycine-generating enzyme required for sulfatase activity